MPARPADGRAETRLTHEHRRGGWAQNLSMAAIEHENETESDPVFLWRLQALERAGYAPSDARLLAAAPAVDLRFAERLLAAGCRPSTAARILI